VESGTREEGLHMAKIAENIESSEKLGCVQPVLEMMRDAFIPIKKFLYRVLVVPHAIFAL